MQCGVCKIIDAFSEAPFCAYAAVLLCELSVNEWIIHIKYCVFEEKRKSRLSVD